jgi:hypothetical protein
VASACGFRGPYSCGAAGEFHPFPLIRLQPIIDFFSLSSLLACRNKTLCASSLGQNQPRLIATTVASSAYRGGKIERPFSLFRRGRLKNALGRFPGLGFDLLAAPSHQPQADSDLRCGFRRLYSGGTAPDFHRSSLTPRASNNEAEITTRSMSCQALFSLLANSQLSVAPLKISLPQKMSQNTTRIVITRKGTRDNDGPCEFRILAKLFCENEVHGWAGGEFSVALQ